MSEQRNLWAIRRFKRGRAAKRWLTDSQVANYKANNPTWTFTLVRREGSSPEYRYVRNPVQTWGRITSHSHEVFESRQRASDTNIPTISYDDILDVMLEIEKVGKKRTQKV